MLLFCTLVMISLAATSRPVIGQDEMLDPTFGFAGKVVTNLGANDEARDVAIQPDGKIVVAGYTGNDIAVVRYTPDGTLDPEFGTAGMVIQDLGGTESIEAVALQSDGKIVAVGRKNYSMLVVRYLATGELDTSFGEGGWVERGLGSASRTDVATDVAIQPDGKLVISGFKDQRARYSEDMVILRYTEDGNADSTFGSDGVVMIDLGGYEQAQSVALDNDGKIVLGGWHGTFLPNFDSAVARYDSGGSREWVTLTDMSPPHSPTHPAAESDYIFSLAIAPDGGILATGYANAPGNVTYLALARYGAAGELSSEFGDGGIVLQEFDDRTRGYGLAVQTNGAIVVSGAVSDLDPSFFTTRFTPAGLLDQAFGQNGKIITHFESRDSGARAVAIQPTDGKIVAAGYVGEDGDRDFALVRYRASLHVVDELGNPVEGATFQPACGGSWQPVLPGATDDQGRLFAEIPACMTKIRARVGNSSQQLTKAELETSGYTYTTEVLRVNLKDHAGVSILDQAGSLRQGGGTWIDLGNFNASGYVDVQTFPVASGRYRATYNCTSEIKNGIAVDLGLGIQEVDFQTGQVLSSCGHTQYQGCGWSTFTNGMELMPGTRKYRRPVVTETLEAGGVLDLCSPTEQSTLRMVEPTHGDDAGDEIFLPLIRQ